ncbi:GumC family protein [Algibacter miyuki]|uniref:non-specific protein-tyrosine kinase n=1 Tax=Algibacter miyuki TaxID=1306933 RepID=A0ABV5GYB1_9FLAO|nr:tyrosine-protein kinase family protein [Algibacter miyuki]MDN3667166.1 polysaccharide biosynthesis tyrosine autokinase [Algibacter miyuki]
MISNENRLDSEHASSNHFNLKKTIGLYTKHWIWFVISILFFGVLAYFQIRTTIPKYGATAKIMLLGDNDGTGGANALKELSLFSENEAAEVDDEIQVMTSRTFMKDIVKKLNLNIQYFAAGRVNEYELYKSNPFHVNFILSDSIVDNIDFNFYVDVISATEFNYRVLEDDVPQKMTFGKNISTIYGSLVLMPRDGYQGVYTTTIRVKVTPVMTVATFLNNNVSVSPIAKSSKVLSIYYEDNVLQKAKDVINTVIETYNKTTLEKKNIRSENTVKFIEKRIDSITYDLVNVDNNIVRYKTVNKITDVASEAGQFLASSTLNEQQIDGAKTELRKLNYMTESLGDDSTFAPIPSNLGLGDASISTLSSKYNELLRERDSKLQSAGERNPIVLELNETLKGIKSNLNNNIKNSKQALDIQINSLQNQSTRLSSKIYAVPGQESKLRSIERKQGIKEQIYLFLLEKREEAAITLTATTPNLKIIDDAYSYGEVTMDGKVLYIGALFFGFLIPFGFIYARDLLDTKIHNREDLHNAIKNITILGEVPRLAKSDKKLVERNDRSVLSESFRIIRTNFDFVRRGRSAESYNNVMFVTSTINGEGKSFFSMNMALTLASTNKKVLLIGGDIRNPQIFSTIRDIEGKEESNVGFTEFIADESIQLNNTISEHAVNDIKIDLMFSGKIPPNPAELLMSDRVKELFDTVSSDYDYVIVDTAPSMLVTDTLLISKYAAHTFYITRAGYTEKEILNFTKEIHADEKLNGMMLVVNDVDQSNFGYGAKYGYYGAPKKKGWFRKNKA